MKIVVVLLQQMCYIKHMIKKKSKRKIVDNKKFTEELAKYVQEFKRMNPEMKKPYNRPQASNYLGSCVMLIAKHFAQHPSFYGYSWKEEMISDAVENFIRYMHNFDETRTNGHAYATMTMKRAFILRIKKEKKQSKVKNKIMMNFDFDSISETQDGDDCEYHNQYVQTMQRIASENADVPEQPKEKKVRVVSNENSLEEIL